MEYKVVSFNSFSFIATKSMFDVLRELECILKLRRTLYNCINKVLSFFTPPVAN